VEDALFRSAGPFFDPRDLVQVKYEMLRCHHADGVPIAEAARRFGLSRQTFYLTDAAFRTARLFGLLPGRPGPKGPRKVTPDMAAFLRAQHREHPELGYADLGETAADTFGVRIHPRTVRRLLSKKKLLEKEG
jgi:transposase